MFHKISQFLKYYDGETKHACGLIPGCDLPSTASTFRITPMEAARICGIVISPLGGSVVLKANHGNEMKHKPICHTYSTFKRKMKEKIMDLIFLM